MPGEISRNLPAADLADNERQQLRDAGRIAELEAALQDAIEGMEDMLPYVPEYFREKWDHQAYVDRARIALGQGVT